jgi:hypothetical protein
MGTWAAGGPCGSRTHDQRIKSPLLYQTELTAQPKKGYLYALFVYLSKGFFLKISGKIEVMAKINIWFSGPQRFYGRKVGIRRHSDGEIWLLGIEYILLFYLAYVKICSCNFR